MTQTRSPSRLPTGWHWQKLGQVATFINGRAFKPDDWTASGLPIVRIQNLTTPSAPFNYFDQDVEPRHRIDDGDLLVSWSASLDAFVWTRGPAVLNQHIFKVIEQPALVHRRYLYHAIRGAMARIRSQVHGATMQHITKGAFEATPILLAPLPEQRRIATILDEQMNTIQKACAAAAAQLGAAKALPAAYLRKTFDSSEAERWPHRSLREIASLGPAKAIMTTGETEVVAVTTACLTEWGFDPHGLKTARMREADAAVSVLERGEVLVARSNTPALVGRAAMFPGHRQPIVASDLTIRVSAGADVSPPFLAAYLSFVYVSGHWRSQAGGASGTMKKITRRQLRELAIPVPPLDAQKRIAELLRDRNASSRSLQLAAVDHVGVWECLPDAQLRHAFRGEP